MPAFIAEPTDSGCTHRVQRHDINTTGSREHNVVAVVATESAVTAMESNDMVHNALTGTWLMMAATVLLLSQRFQLPPV